MSGLTGFAPIAHRHAGPRARLAAMSAAFGRMVRAATSRRYLLEMDDHMLHDLGISRAQANFEASRAPWETGPTRR